VNGVPQKVAVKVPLPLKCSGCGEMASIKIHLDNTTFDWTCPKCGFFHPSFLGLDLTIGFLILLKSRHEIISERDFSMAIVLAAMAFESQLSYLFGKWSAIDASKAGRNFDRTRCESEMRKFGTVDRKIAEVSKLLVGKGIDEFVSAYPDLHQAITNDFKSIRLGFLARDFQEHLFWPRNAILHWGDAKNSLEDASRCYSFANLGLLILQKMDEQRRLSLGLPSDRRTDS
jgi:hypothetical protein